MKLIFVQPELCTGCRICEVACSFIKTKKFNPAESKIKIIKVEEKGIDLPSMCLHCEDAPCMDICPVGALKRKHNSVILDENVCLGCRMCLMVCPFGGIDIGIGKPVKCDLCNGDPFCVKVCPTGAIKYEEELKIRLGKSREYVKEIVRRL